MRRWMIVLMVASLFVAIAATPGSADKKELPEPVEFAGGWVSYGAVEARTGEFAGGPVLWKHGWTGTWDHLMNPDFNKCKLVSAELVWIDKNTAELTTIEDCRNRWIRTGQGWLPTLPPFPPGYVKTFPPAAPNFLDPADLDALYVRHHKVVHITKGGAVKMSPGNKYPTFWQKIPELTGCGVNGTFPIYHGHLDGERLYATAHYHGPCDGGSLPNSGWWKFGIGLDDGPIHVTYTFDLLRVVD